MEYRRISKEYHRTSMGCSRISKESHGNLWDIVEYIISWISMGHRIISKEYHGTSMG